MNMEKGLLPHEVAELEKKFGKNVIESYTTSSLTSILFAQFATLINLILAIAALFSFLIKNLLDGGFIAAVIVVNACFGFIQEYRAQKSLEKLRKYAPPTARVIRSGKEEQILAEDLVPDDIVVLTEGARVPADGVLVDVTHLEVDEAIITGESLGAIKNTSEDVYMGTLVLKGKGIFRVNKIGMNTRFGQIARTLSTIHNDRPPLQVRIDQLGKALAFWALLLGILIIPIGLTYKQDYFQVILVGISIGIAAIPESLPGVVTIAYALGTLRMAKHGAIVRKLASIETLGAIQVILLDKTGTITKNAMEVKKFWVTGKKSLPLLAEACILGNTASLVQKGRINEFEVIGDATDGALLLWAKNHKPQFQPAEGHIIDEYVFDTKTKTITTVWKKEGKMYVFVRGAPEEVLAKSALPQKEKTDITSHFEEFAKDGYRVIAFAIKSANYNSQTSREHLEKDLKFLGFVGIYDPPRADVKEAIKKARLAGIHVAMVTGDNELTAFHLAKEIGLIEKNEDVVTSDEMASISDSELLPLILKTSIFARTKPEDKLRLVSVLKDKGIIVGVTGDGVNDALALKKADVGVAMGIGGTDVAQEAADIILTDNSFATLIKAVEEGRVIYKNIVNAIIYLLSGNLAEISLVFFATLFKFPFPLVPTQILWINLITDSLPALALAAGSRDGSILSKKPRDANDSLLSAKKVLIIILIGMSLSTFLLFIFFFLLLTYTQEQARTVVFNLLIYFHLIIVMIIGRHSLRKKNIFLILTIILIFLLQFLINVIPFFQQIFHLESF